MFTIVERRLDPTLLVSQGGASVFHNKLKLELCGMMPGSATYIKQQKPNGGSKIRMVITGNNISTTKSK